MREAEPPTSKQHRPAEAESQPPGHISVSVSGDLRSSEEPGALYVFVCHASEDKENFVRPLAEGLKRRGVRVWYDEFTLKVGDSLRREIDRGLREARFGIVVLSPSFFEKEWPQYELDGLVEKEIGGEKVILPIWHEVTREEVLRYSPSLAGRLAANSSDGLQAVVDKLLHAMGAPVGKERAPHVDRGEETGASDNRALSDWLVHWGVVLAGSVLILGLSLLLAKFASNPLFVTRAPEGGERSPSTKPSSSGQGTPQAHGPREARVNPAVKKNWRAYLRNGMSKDDVRGLFGEPEDVSVIDDLETWWYRGGYIDFDRGKLFGWSEPESDPSQSPKLPATPSNSDSPPRPVSTKCSYPTRFKLGDRFQAPEPHLPDARRLTVWPNGARKLRIYGGAMEIEYDGPLDQQPTIRNHGNCWTGSGCVDWWLVFEKPPPEILQLKIYSASGAQIECIDAIK